MDVVYFTPHHVPSTRVWRVGVSVLTAHLALLWVTHADFSDQAVTNDGGQVVMASVVSETPQPTPVSKPEPKPTPRPEPKKQVQKSLEQPVAVADNAASQEVAVVPPTSSTTSSSAAKAGTPDVVQPSADADYLNNPSPHYPHMSRRLGEQGTTVVRVLITVQGTAEKVEIRTSSGHPRLDQAALDAVQRWRFVPGKRHGTPEAMWFNIPVRFVLE